MKRILLFLCLIFVVVAYGYPCFALPFGTYKNTIEYDGVKTTTTLNLKFNGTAVMKVGDVETTYNYKINDGEVELYIEGYENEPVYEFEIHAFNKVGNMTNMVGTYISIAFGVVAIIAICLPYKKK